MKRLALASLLAVIALLVACSFDNPAATNDGILNNLPASGGSCDTPQTGCACPTNGALVNCGVVSGVSPDGHPMCAMGFRRCESGQWGACDALKNVTPKPQGLGGGVKLLDLVPNGKCSDDPCDPYCQEVAESPDGGWGAGDGGVVSGDADINGLLEAGGKSWDGGLYHVMAPGDVAIDPVNASTTINSVDVYFMFNSTTGMQNSITQLASQMPTVVSSIQAAIPNVAFGDGRFTNYEAWPYGSQESGNVVYENRTSISTTASNTVSDVQWMAKNPGSVFVNTPYVVGQSTTPALYAMASNATLEGWFQFSFPSYGADWWWNVYSYYGERGDAYLMSPFYSPGPVCGSGGVGAPCFRPSAYHIVMLFQDAPIMNGAAGSFPYYQMKPQYFPWSASADYTTDNSWYWYQSKSLGSSSPNLPTTEGSTQLVSIPGSSVGKPLVFTGNVSGQSSQASITSSSTYVAGATQTCTLNGSSIATGADVYYDFSVSVAGTRYWFDTVGSSYDTVLYLIDKATGNIVGCQDDGFAWLSAVDIGVPDEWIGQHNSALVGTLPVGNYRLVLDKYDNSAFPSTSSNTGIYELNMWPNIDDPKLGGNPHGTALTTPSYSQMLSALSSSGVNAMVTAIDMSGLTCGQNVTSWENAFTRWSLEQLATDTGAVVAGQPVVLSVQQDGTPGPVKGSDPLCPTGANLGTVVSTAIANLTGNLAQTITAKVIDDDDLTDFDGTTGINAGPTVLTPPNIDDATFVTNIVAQPAAGCTGPSGNTYASCTPGSTPNFQVSFAVPSTVPQRANPQIFQFHVELHGVSNTLLSSTPVMIVVPAGAPKYVATDFIRDFDGSSACPSGTVTNWTVYNWNTTTPGDSYIDFFVTAADTSAGLSTATELSPAFGTANLGAQIGAVDMGSFMEFKGVPKTTLYTRVRAHIVPTSDGSQSPTLFSYGMAVDCVPSL